ncbi:FAD-dependent monooxygenase [Croceicoccus sp. YJ47]|uniref:FAD-dependent monooxygenase n=1 Tax=Croceicoccus sp. YJ47 TaxID=2798724 RepID=UPI0035300F25
MAAGAEIRLGVVAHAIEDDGAGVTVRLSDGSEDRFDIVIGADGIYSDTRQRIMPEAGTPEYTGQAVWRYNLPRPDDLDALHAFNGPTGVGLVPMSSQMMYMFVTTPEPGNPRYDKAGIARAMREKLSGTAPQIRELAKGITDDEGVVYRPLETMLLYGAWSRGRVVLLGDAVHATTPHLGQGAGMAIEDSIVLAEELARADTPEDAFAAYRERRFERCRYIVESSLAICHGQIGKSPPVDNHAATTQMFEVCAQPI